MKSYPWIIIAKFSIKEALFNQIITFIIIALSLIWCGALFAGYFLIDPAGTTKIAVFAYISRLFLVISMSLLVTSLSQRELHGQGILLILSHSISKQTYYFGKLAGFLCIGLLFSLITLLLLCISVPLESAMRWSLSLFCELSIVIGFSLFCMISLRNAIIVVGLVMGFYFLSRSIKVLTSMSHSTVLGSDSLSLLFMGKILDLIAYIIPDLHRFTQTIWLIEHQYDADLFPIICQTLIYLLVLSVASCFDLQRKRI